MSLWGMLLQAYVEAVRVGPDGAIAKTGPLRDLQTDGNAQLIDLKGAWLIPVRPVSPTPMEFCGRDQSR